MTKRGRGRRCPCLSLFYLLSSAWCDKGSITAPNKKSNLAIESMSSVKPPIFRLRVGVGIIITNLTSFSINYNAFFVNCIGRFLSYGGLIRHLLGLRFLIALNTSEPSFTRLLPNIRLVLPSPCKNIFEQANANNVSSFSNPINC